MRHSCNFVQGVCDLREFPPLKFWFRPSLSSLRVIPWKLFCFGACLCNSTRTGGNLLLLPIAIITSVSSLYLQLFCGVPAAVIGLPDHLVVKCIIVLCLECYFSLDCLHWKLWFVVISSCLWCWIAVVGSFKLESLGDFSFAISLSMASVLAPTIFKQIAFECIEMHSVVVHIYWGVLYTTLKHLISVSVSFKDGAYVVVRGWSYFFLDLFLYHHAPSRNVLLKWEWQIKDLILGVWVFLDYRFVWLTWMWCVAAFKALRAERMGDSVPGLALLGAGTFALSQYVPKLGELAHLASVKVIWSRSQVEASFHTILWKTNTKRVECVTPYLLSFTERQLTALFDMS